MNFYLPDQATPKEEKRRCVSVTDSRKTESCTPKTRTELKSRQKIALLNFFNQDCDTRKLEEKLMQENKKLAKESNLKHYSEGKAFRSSRKYALQKQRLSCILKEHEDCMNVLNEKHRRSCRSTCRSVSTSFSKWREKSKEKLEQVKVEEEKNIRLKIDSFKKREKKSDLLRQEHLRRISQSAGKLAGKAKEVREKFVKIGDISSVKYLNLISKDERTDSKKAILQQALQRNIEKKRKNSVEKKIKIDMSLNELNLAKQSKEKDLENKQIKAAMNFRLINKKIEHFLEHKQEQFKLRLEKSFSKILSQKKQQFLSKQSIISKHKQLDNKLRIRKKVCEHLNQKLRDKSVQEATDRLKARNMKLAISKSKDPLNIASLLSDF